MKLKYTLLFCSLFFLQVPAFSQDIHFSLFDRSPLTLNPAYAGAFEGTFRIGGIYRDQWRSFLGRDAFTTPSFFLDAPLFKGLGKMDWIGVGFMAYSDKAGSSELGWSTGMLTGAYHLSLDGDRKSVLTIGVQGGYSQRRFKYERLQFGDELDPTAPPNFQSPDRGQNEEKQDFLDINAGIMLRSQLNDRMQLTFGVSGYHINSPKEGGGFKNRQLKLDPNINVHGRFNIDLDDKWSLSPAFFYQTAGPADEPVVQVWGGYLLNPEKQIKLHFGTGYRLRDAAELLFGLDIKSFSVALAYDVNTSQLTEATNSVGGFEIAASYIARIFTKPEVKPAILCPRF